MQSNILGLTQSSNIVSTLSIIRLSRVLDVSLPLTFSMKVSAGTTFSAVICFTTSCASCMKLESLSERSLRHKCLDRLPCALWMAFSKASGP